MIRHAFLARTRAPWAAALAVAIPLAAAPLLAPLLGRLGGALVLLLVLPPLAAALAALGWPARIADALATVPGPRRRVLLAYAGWLAASALLGLDVAVLVAAFVAIAATRPNAPERRLHLAAAIVGANVGSLLFPFSNLTNLVVAGGAGTTFGGYVAASWLPQAVAALAGAIVLAFVARPLARDPGSSDGGSRRATGRARPIDRPAALGAVLAVAAGVAAVCLGFGGGDVTLPFALAAAGATGLAVASGRLAPREAARSLPVAGIALVIGAALVAAALPSVVALLPRLPAGAAGLVVAALVGGLLSALVNNLPAALLGALWLGPAGAPVVVAYLVGTNVAALATPHGSVATMLARDLAGRDGEELSARRYLARGWRYALPPALAALAVIALVAR